MLDIKDLTLIIDPLDGTNSFIDKDYRSTSVLIGLLSKNLPIFGFVGAPFISLKDDTVNLYFNLPSLGVFEFVVNLNGEILAYKHYKSSIDPNQEENFKFITSIRKYQNIKDNCIILLK
jgi:3'-phosphoadenosine 5'-phosphosulfate (PAPS) 3'-phosphatase